MLGRSVGRCQQSLRILQDASKASASCKIAAAASAAKAVVEAAMVMAAAAARASVMAWYAASRGICEQRLSTRERLRGLGEESKNGKMGVVRDGKGCCVHVNGNAGVASVCATGKKVLVTTMLSAKIDWGGAINFYLLNTMGNKKRHNPLTVNQKLTIIACRRVFTIHSRHGDG